MSALKDETGKRYGRLLVLGREANASRGQARWLCLCDCGEKTVVRGGDLRFLKFKSCGCLARDRASEANTTHGMSETRIYRVWAGMIQRCANPHSRYYKNYGGRGIKICEKWFDFAEFMKDMGPRPQGLSLDRIDNAGNYEPGNCRWATRSQQNYNRRKWTCKRKEVAA